MNSAIDSATPYRYKSSPNKMPEQIKIIEFFSCNLSVIIVGISTAAMTKNNNTFTVYWIIYFNIKTVVVMCLHLDYFCLFHKFHAPGNSGFIWLLF